MKVTVLSITRVNDDEEYEIRLKVGDDIHCGRTKRDASLPVAIWHPDKALRDCLRHLPMASRWVHQVVADFRSMKEIQFPVEVGDFEQIG